MRRPTTPAVGPVLLLDVGAAQGTTLTARVSAAIRQAVAGGRLGPGTRLPSSRALATDLGLSRGVVVAAYARLTDEGVLVSRPGSATRVAQIHPAPPARPCGACEVEPTDVVGIDLRPGPPDLSAFPRRAWLTALRSTLDQLPDSELGYVNPWGADAPRTALAAYLARVRGAVVTPETVVVVGGVTQGLTLLVRLLRSTGHLTLAVESPSNSVQRDVLGSHGLTVIDVPTDEEGIDVQALARTPCHAVLVTPAHQFPTGTQLSAERRASLLRWAEDVDAVVLEDDYDAEFRYERQPVGCLQGQAPARVALVGSVSKTLAPGLRLGWVVPPPSLLDGLLATKRDDDFGSGVLDQHALARLLTSGAYDGHLRTLRRRYRERRDALVSAVACELPGWRTTGVAAGLHLLLDLPAGVDEEELVGRAAEQGLLVQGTRGMYGSLPPRPGLVLSYARGPATLLHEGMRRLAGAAQLAGAGELPGGPAPRRGRLVPATAEDYFWTVGTSPSPGPGSAHRRRERL